MERGGGKPSRLTTVTPYKNMGLILNNFKNSARLFLFFFIFLREDRGGGPLISRRRQKLQIMQGSRGRQRLEYIWSAIIKDQYSLSWTKISTK